MPATPMLERTGGHLYEALAGQLASAIEAGSLKSGDRLPSVRKLSGQYGVSIATAVQACRELENQRLVEARPKSGFYVATRRAPRLPEPELSQPPAQARYVVMPSLLQEYVEALAAPDAVRLGAVLPQPGAFPSARLATLMASEARRHPQLTTTYTLGNGAEPLRRVIARRAVEWGCRLTPDDIVVTYGCIEALNLSLRAVARPGDTVAVESPTYFLLLHVIESLGMKVLEIPSHPRSGVSLEALDLAIATHAELKAVMLMPSYANPLGSCMPDEHKARVVALCEEHGIALIEDDIFGETGFGASRPLPAKAWDASGNVMLCSSFTKTLAPGLRVGWLAPGRWRKEVELLKRATTMFVPVLPQLAIAQFAETGGYDHHLRKLRASLAERARHVSDAIAHHFPAGCRLTRPNGGYVLWIELPQAVDAVALFRRARADHIVVAPGPLFTAGPRLRNFIRISHAQDWTPATEAALARVGALAREMAG